MYKYILGLTLGLIVFTGVASAEQTSLYAIQSANELSRTITFTGSGDNAGCNISATPLIQCEDISGTSKYINGMKDVARQILSKGQSHLFPSLSYWFSRV